MPILIIIFNGKSWDFKKVITHSRKDLNFISLYFAGSVLPIFDNLIYFIETSLFLRDITNSISSNVFFFEN